MENQKRPSMAGGFLLALSILIGAFVGIAKGQASIGFIVGLAVGVVSLVAVWVLDRRRH